MTTFVLHGGYTGDDNDSNRGFFNEIVAHCPEGGTVLCIYFAREEEVHDKLFAEDIRHLTLAAKAKGIKILSASKERFISELEKADVLYIRGGNTAKLQHDLDQYSEFPRMIKGKTLAGSSAGAYVLSQHYYSRSRGGVFRGFGFLPIKLVCHYQSERYEGKEVDPIGALVNDGNLELVVLRDFEWKTFQI